jgi:hypothetical protein
MHKYGRARHIITRFLPGSCVRSMAGMACPTSLQIVLLIVCVPLTSNQSGAESHMCLHIYVLHSESAPPLVLPLLP